MEPCCEDVVRRLLASFLQLDEKDAKLVLWMARGKTLAEFGRMNGVSRQAAWQRLIRVNRWTEELRALFKSGAKERREAKKAKARRSRRRHVDSRQLDFCGVLFPPTFSTFSTTGGF